MKIFQRVGFKEIQNISEDIKDKTPFPEFQKQLEDDYQKFY